MPQHPPVDSEFLGAVGRPSEIDVDLLCIPIFQGDASGEPETFAGLDDRTREELTRARTSGEFRGKPFQLVVTPVAGSGWKARRVALVGAGRRSDWNAERVKRVAATASYAARQHAAVSLGFVVRETDGAPRIAERVADGLSASEFEIGAYKRGDEPCGPFPSRVVVVAPGADAGTIAAAVARGRVIGQAVNHARALANEPGNVLTPRVFAARVAALAEAATLGVEIFDEDRLRALGMGLLLGVSQGSAEPPRLVVLRHEPAGAPAGPVLALIGKGITFDSGGISIKPADAMDRMKSDMSGGAAVAAAMTALARLGAPHRVIGLIPMSENMPGGRATRPGDVLTGAGGKTVEIINTDAEGRLVLGDALWYAQQLGATHLIDVATLTGACVVALGRYVSGLFSNDDRWAETVLGAAARSGDRLWRMPLYEESRDQIKSDIADLVNSAGRPGGAVTAAAFLREFVDDRPWAHLDIAGTAWAEERKAYQPKGPTGVAVRTLIELGMTGGSARPESAD